MTEYKLPSYNKKNENVCSGPLGELALKRISSYQEEPSDGSPSSLEGKDGVL